MCLRNITERIDPPDPTEHTGYKVVITYPFSASYLLPCYDVHDGKRRDDAAHIRFLKRGHWYKARHVPVRTDETVTPHQRSAQQDWYTSGFHIFTTVEDARRCRLGFDAIFEVRYRGVRIVGQEEAQGISPPLTVVVADEILFVSVKEVYEGGHEIRTRPRLGAIQTR